MPSSFHVARAELSFDALFTQPEFGLFRDTNGLLRNLFERLQRHGLRLQDLKVEHGAGSVADYHVVCYLYNFLLVIRVRAEKIEIACFDVPESHVDRFRTAIVDALLAVQTHHPTLTFRTYTLSVSLHGTLIGVSAKDYLSKFAHNVPSGLGPQAGSGAVFYFGAEEDRLLSTVTVDFSAVVADGLFVRPYVVWDATKLQVNSLPTQAATFVRRALACFELDVPTLKS